ncbi:hypothetical protein CDD83_10332 [Cordyceps sp. RAO-2017]|nr:hypothetical protein CDD83_10332 [Cordyceps sp. RAO-2017]
MAATFAPTRATALRHAVHGSPTATLPGFLVPAWQGFRRRQRGQFSTTTKQQSKLGRTPISIPAGVELVMGEPRTMKSKTSWKATVTKTLTVKGPLGTLELEMPPYISLNQNAEEKTVVLSIEDRKARNQREMWGTTWAYVNNHVMGVSEGHSAILRLVGVGYRASVEQRGAKEQFPGQRFLCLKLGFTHPVEEGIPRGVTVTTPTPTRVLLEGPDREALMSFAGRVRQWRKPEPYKGKGIFINDQTIKLKQKKIK